MKPKNWCFQVNKIDKLRLKLTQKEIDNLRNPMPIKQIEFIPNFTTQKMPGPITFTRQFYQIRENM